MHIISSSLVMAQRHRDSATLQPSPAVQHVLNQLNDKYHQCLVRFFAHYRLFEPYPLDDNTSELSVPFQSYYFAFLFVIMTFSIFRPAPRNLPLLEFPQAPTPRLPSFRPNVLCISMLLKCAKALLLMNYMATPIYVPVDTRGPT